jgi:phosphoenolpyruvate synthase/pyruvate phosphate dikinase
MNAFLNWQEAYGAGTEVCGGKGYNLARLARYGFRVPRGAAGRSAVMRGRTVHGVCGRRKHRKS